MNNHQKRRTVTDRSGAILSNRSRRRRAQRTEENRARFMQLIREASDKSLNLIYAAGLLALDEHSGKLAPDDAAQYRALRSADPIDMIAIEAWLTDHGYMERANSL